MVHAIAASTVPTQTDVVPNNGARTAMIDQRAHHDAGIDAHAMHGLGWRAGRLLLMGFRRLGPTSILNERRAGATAGILHFQKQRFLNCIGPIVR